jgi:hypothetical protein
MRIGRKRKQCPCRKQSGHNSNESHCYKRGARSLQHHDHSGSCYKHGQSRPSCKCAVYRPVGHPLYAAALPGAAFLF